MKTIFFGPMLVLAISGCTTPILRTAAFPDLTDTTPTDSITPTKSLTAPARIGVPYYLPRALVPITIVLDNNNPSEDTPEKLKDSKQTKDQKTQESETKPDNETAPTKQDAPTTLTDVSQKIGQYRVTIGAPLLTPDTSRPPFFLEYNPEGATDDDINIGVGANQLLQTTKATSIDRSGEAVIKLAEIGIRAAVSFGLQRRYKTVARCPELESVKIFTYLDPSLTEEEQTPFSINALNDLLALNHVPMKFTVTPVSATVTKQSGILQRNIDDLEAWITELKNDSKKETNREAISSYEHDLKQAQSAVDELKAALEKQQKKERDDEKKLITMLNEPRVDLDEISKRRTAGILFRTSEPYVVELFFGPRVNMSAKKQPWCIVPEAHQMMVMAPNKGRVYAVDVNRGALITKKTDLTIVDGMLTKIDVNKPSSVIGLLNVPIAIIKLPLSIVNEVLTIRLQKIGDERDIIKAQSEKFIYELERFNNHKALQDALKSVPEQ